ncbi:MAG: hypothetical protein ACKVTZ_23945, partial [Bacteroidia bacterium]
MQKTVFFMLLASFLGIFSACDRTPIDPEPNPTGAKLIFKFKLDSTQTRLNNFGTVATIPAG